MHNFRNEHSNRFLKIKWNKHQRYLWGCKMLNILFCCTLCLTTHFYLYKNIFLLSIILEKKKLEGIIKDAMPDASLLLLYWLNALMNELYTILKQILQILPSTPLSDSDRFPFQSSGMRQAVIFSYTIPQQAQQIFIERSILNRVIQNEVLETI